MPVLARVRRTAAVAAAGVVLAACTSTPAPEPSPTPSGVPAATASPAVTPTPEETEQPQPWPFAVAAGDPAAVDAGMAILGAGGNAVDAAIAAAFAVAVVEPYASGIGGGGTALVVGADGAVTEAFDYREVVPLSGAIPGSGTGVPGFVAGMGALHDAHGRLGWEDLLAPAIDLARGGHPASQMLAVRLREDVGPRIAAAYPQFRTGAGPLGTGDLLVQEELAATMETLAEEGPGSFYTGALAADVARAGGLDAASLAEYQPVRGEPVRGPVGENEILGPMPPLPGAPFVQMLQVADALGADDAAPGSAEFIDRISRAWRVADRTTSTELGDPAFVEVPVAEITDPVRNAAVAQDVAASAQGQAMQPEAGNTTHISVVDSDGTVVSMTNTLTHWFGSADYVAGFFLNDQLTRFAAIGTTAANAPVAGKRSVSWSLPVIILDGEGRPVLVIGTPGGRLIPNILASVILRWRSGQPLAEAVDAPRFHLEGTTLQVEAVPPDGIANELRNLGYGFEVVPPGRYAFGSVQGLVIDPESRSVSGAVDARREADVAVSVP